MRSRKEYHYAKTCNMSICLVSSTKLSNNCYDKYFLQGITNIGHKMTKLNTSTICFSLIVEDFSKRFIKSPSTSKNFFCYTSFFLKGTFTPQNIDMEELDIFAFLNASYIFKHPFIRPFTSLSNFLAITECFAFTCFLSVVMPLVLQ
jgi:hypothetical protein